MGKNGDKSDPVLDLSVDTPREFKITIRGSLIEKVSAYAQYHDQVKGGKSTPARVVEEALQRVFSADKAFGKFFEAREVAKVGAARSAAPGAPAQS